MPLQQVPSEAGLGPFFSFSSLSSRNSQLLCRFLMLGVCRNLVQKPAEEVPSALFCLIKDLIPFLIESSSSQQKRIVYVRCLGRSLIF